MKEIHKLILAISKEAALLRNPLKPGINHQVYKKMCKGLNNELFQPTWALPYPELPEVHRPQNEQLLFKKNQHQS